MSEEAQDFSFQNTAPTRGPIPAHEYIQKGHKMGGILFKLGKLAKMPKARMTKLTAHKPTKRKTK